MKLARRVRAIVRLSPREMMKHRQWLAQGLLRLLGKRDPRLRRLSPRTIAAICQPLIDPPSVAAADAAYMRDDDVVVGLAWGGEAKAYPWWIMDNHHLANDVVGGRPVVLAFCEMCSSAIALDPVVGGRRLVFDQNHIYNGMVAMQDRATRSVWSPYLGKAIRGRLAGVVLGPLPAAHLTWTAWRELHPESRVLPAELGSREGHGSRHGIGDPEILDPVLGTIGPYDARLASNELVMGLALDGVSRAFPLHVLRGAGGVRNDTLSGEPILAMAEMHPGSYRALCFSRRVGGRILTFDPHPDGATDRQTGSTWSAEGRSVDGPMRGRELSFIGGHVGEWFVWSAHYPSTEIAT